MEENKLHKNLITENLRWRCIGPSRGGRVVAVAGDPVNQQVFYFGAAAGGIWKTEDAGVYWENVSDGFLNSSAVGALTVAHSDPNVIYAGMGESTIRIDVSYGDGVYRSTDAGTSWNHLGLPETRQISEIRIHPQNPDLVYVAAFGHAFGPNKERGIFRSKDGGKNWEHILFRSDKAGAIDLSMDPNNPRILIASFWEAHRNFWSLQSGGPGSSIYRSMDGGDSWEEITNNRGLPKGTLGKIGVSLSPAQSGRVWAIIEAEDAGLYRSDDYGESWIRTSKNRDLIHRPWYYCHVFSDPKHADTVYLTNLQMWKSSDGGSSFREITTPHGDNHDLWIDPENPDRMIEGNDGGACVSFNGGKSWSSIYNQCTAQFYRMDLDTQFPYRVYATQQDNTSISVPSASEHGAIPFGEYTFPGTGESGFIAVKPDDPDIVYIGAVGSSPGGHGALQHYNHRTRQLRLINIWPEEHYGWADRDLKYRFSWTFPISFSPHDSNTVYACGNHVFASRDEGMSWEALSPDLTRADDSKLDVSGGLTVDSSGAETYGTISTFAESSHQPGKFWAGTDDGLVHLSTDGGKHWENVTPKDLPEWAYIYCIETSNHDPDVLYLSATRYKLDDYRPYLYKSVDGGRNWKNICGNYPENEISRVIREDPKNPGLLFVGSETGIFFSHNDGANWNRLGGNFPVVPVYDLKIKDDEMVVATHGRSFWILDDLNPIRESSRFKAEDDFHFFPPKSTYRRTLNWSTNLFMGDGKNYSPAFGIPGTSYVSEDKNGEKQTRYLDLGENPPQGVIFHYVLNDPENSKVELQIFDSKGNLIDTFETKQEDKVSGQTENDDEEDQKPALTSSKGLNRFVWNMRYPGPAEKIDKTLEQKRYKALGRGEMGERGGPTAMPGTYQAVLRIENTKQEHHFEILKDPRLETSEEDYQAQFDLWMNIRDQLSETNRLLNQLRRIRREIHVILERPNLQMSKVPDELSSFKDNAEKVIQKLEVLENELVQTKNETPSDRLRFPVMLRDRIEGLISVVAVAEAAPPQQAHEVFQHLKGLLAEKTSSMQQLLSVDLLTLKELAQKANIQFFEE